MPRINLSVRTSQPGYNGAPYLKADENALWNNRDREFDDPESLFTFCENLADEAVASSMDGRCEIRAILTLPCRGGEEYGTDKFTVEIKRGNVRRA